MVQVLKVKLSKRKKNAKIDSTVSGTGSGSY